MEQKGFFQTKAGGLTIAFIVIMIAFAMILAGLYMGMDALCVIGFVLIVAAMLYSPVDVYVIHRKDKR
ncbi:MAG: hypothetical protein Q4D42_11125 [Eubacteriales bacterium]|nr:hypothetical protein [Eubacteriales bacterium]